MLGAWFGAMIGDWIMRRGRRLALRATSLPLAAAWVLTGVAPCVELVYVTSFIGGLCCSVITMVAQVRKGKKLSSRQLSRFPIADLTSFLASPGVHIGDLDAGHPRMPVGDAEGAGPRWRLAVLHSRHVPQLAAKRAAGRRRAVDALPGDPLHTGDPVVPGAERQGRRGRQQSAVATRRPGRHTARAAGNSPELLETLEFRDSSVESSLS